MKRIVALLLFPLACFAQETITFAKETPLQDIVARLFDGKINTTTNEVVWQPNTGEQFQFAANTGEMLYTVIDTTFTYHTGLTQNLVIATATYRKSELGSYIDCHYCGPVLSLITLEDAPEGQHYVVLGFNKYVTHYGTWGEAYALSLLELGNNIPLVVIDWHWFGQGIASGGKTFVYDGKTVLDITTSGDNQEGTDDPKQVYSFETSMVFLIHKGILEFYKMGTEPNSKGKVVKVNRTTQYRFDRAPGTLVRVEE